MTNCTSRAVGAYVASEVSNVVYARHTKPGAPLVLVGEGSHSVADSVLSADSWDRAVALADAGFVVAEGDMGQTTSQGTFGNDTSVTRLGQLATFARGSTSPVAAGSQKLYIVGGSGGCTAAINYARANPTLVAALYLIVPLVDVEDFHDNYTNGGANGTGAQSSGVTPTEIETVYGGSAAYTAAMPSHNPIRTGNQAALASVPMKLVYSTNDPFISLPKVQAYASLVNAAGGSAVIASQGAVGHSGVGVDPANVVAFFRGH